MRRALLRRAPLHGVLAALTALALLAPPPGSASAGAAVRASARAMASHGRDTAVARRTLHKRFYGYLRQVVENAPGTDGVGGVGGVDGMLKIFSKTHNTTYVVYLTTRTQVKIRTQVVQRARLAVGLYVIATCLRRADGKYEALTVHIELRHRRSRKKKT
jgi:hypothetical protein